MTLVTSLQIQVILGSSHSVLQGPLYRISMRLVTWLCFVLSLAVRSDWPLIARSQTTHVIKTFSGPALLFGRKWRWLTPVLPLLSPYSGLLISLPINYTVLRPVSPIDNGLNRPRGLPLPAVVHHFQQQQQLAYINQPKCRVTTDVLHVIMTSSVAVNRMLKTTGRDWTDVHGNVCKGNVECDVPWGFFL